MQLASWNSQRRHLNPIRKLTAEELREHARLMPLVKEAENRLALFRLLTRNYEEWRTFLNKLLNSLYVSDGNDAEELNRLILNYLTLGYSIRQHFEVTLKQRFRKDESMIRAYDDFILRLCKISWGFAFILDFRGYVHHRGLPVDVFRRTVSETSVKISISANPERLLAESRDWRFSGLQLTHRKIDLIDVLKEFQVQMLQSYGTYVAKLFLPELGKAAPFYATLTREATANDPSARMVFLRKIQTRKAELGANTHLQIRGIEVPNNLFQELGLIATVPADGQAGPIAQGPCAFASFNIGESLQQLSLLQPEEG